MGKLMIRIPGSRLFISSLPGLVLRTLSNCINVCQASDPMSTLT